jgi:transcriptional regulator with XRE-family HTH domain
MDAIAIEHRAEYVPGVMLTGSQIRAARALLGWSSQQLADRSGVHYATVSRAEQTDDVPSMRTASLRALQTALEAGGIIFLSAGDNRDGGPGVRLR